MDLNVVMQAIATLGFPICMCVAMFWYINKQTEQHREESAKMVEAINRLELKITQLITGLTVRNGDENNE